MGQKSAAKWAKNRPPNGLKIDRVMGQNRPPNQKLSIGFYFQIFNLTSTSNHQVFNSLIKLQPPSLQFFN
jgi:hypothetical protein